MIKTDFLKKGDTILLLSPAGKISQENVLPAVSILENWGLKVKIMPHSFEEYYRFSGTLEHRISDMQMALDDKDAKAILCNRGGYGCIHLIEKLDFSSFVKHPKWLIGFSDITVFHSYFNTILRCETLHAAMPVNLSQEDIPKETLENTRKALFGEKLAYNVIHNQLNINGITSGELIGGNLATLCNLLNTPFGYSFEDKILFIEDVGEPIHKIDQMLYALKISKKLASLKGLIVGGFSDIDFEPEFGKTIQEIIYDTVSEYKFPVVFDFPTGHIPHNYPLYIGAKVTLEVTKEQSTLSF